MHSLPVRTQSQFCTYAFIAQRRSVVLYPSSHYEGCLYVDLDKTNAESTTAKTFLQIQSTERGFQKTDFFEREKIKNKIKWDVSGGGRPR